MPTLVLPTHKGPPPRPPKPKPKGPRRNLDPALEVTGEEELISSSLVAALRKKSQFRSASTPPTPTQLPNAHLREPPKKTWGSATLPSLPTIDSPIGSRPGTRNMTRQSVTPPPRFGDGQSDSDTNSSGSTQEPEEFDSDVFDADMVREQQREVQHLTQENVGIIYANGEWKMGSKSLQVQYIMDKHIEAVEELMQAVKGTPQSPTSPSKVGPVIKKRRKKPATAPRSPTAPVGDFANRLYKRTADKDITVGGPVKILNKHNSVMLQNGLTYETAPYGVQEIVNARSASRGSGPSPGTAPSRGGTPGLGLGLDLMTDGDGGGGTFVTQQPTLQDVLGLQAGSSDEGEWADWRGGGTPGYRGTTREGPGGIIVPPLIPPSAAGGMCRQMMASRGGASLDGKLMAAKANRQRIREERYQTVVNKIHQRQEIHAAAKVMKCTKEDRDILNLRCAMWMTFIAIGSRIEMTWWKNPGRSKTTRILGDLLLPMWRRKYKMRRRRAARSLLNALGMRKMSLPTPQQLRDSGALFKSWPYHLLNKFIGQLRPMVHIRGEYICHEGDPSPNLYLLMRGSVDVYKRLKTGKSRGADDKPLVSLPAGRPGDPMSCRYFGEYGVFTGECRAATLYCTEMCYCWVISAPAFILALRRLPKEVYDGVSSALEQQMKNIYSIHPHQIENLPLFSTRKDSVQEVIKKMEPTIFRPKEFIFKAGEPGSYIYIISRGKVDLYTHLGKYADRSVEEEFSRREEERKRKKKDAQSLADLDQKQKRMGATDSTLPYFMRIARRQKVSVKEKKKEEDRMPHTTLETGKMFGERPCLHLEPNCTTAITQNTVQCWRLSKADLKNYLLSAPQIMIDTQAELSRRLALQIPIVPFETFTTCPLLPHGLQKSVLTSLYERQFKPKIFAATEIVAPPSSPISEVYYICAGELKQVGAEAPFPVEGWCGADLLMAEKPWWPSQLVANTRVDVWSLKLETVYTNMLVVRPPADQPPTRQSLKHPDVDRVFKIIERVKRRQTNEESRQKH